MFHTNFAHLRVQMWNGFPMGDAQTIHRDSKAYLFLIEEAFLGIPGKLTSSLQLKQWRNSRR